MDDENIKVCKLCGEVVGRLRNHLDEIHDIKTSRLEDYEVKCISADMVSSDVVNFTDEGIVNVKLVEFDEGPKCVWISRNQQARTRRYRLKEYYDTHRNIIYKLYDRGYPVIITPTNEITKEYYTSALVKFDAYKDLIKSN
jgi:hypothetical protein